MLTDLVGTRLGEHGAILMNPDWYSLTMRAHQALFDLYQAIGEAHLEAEPDRVEGRDRD